MMPYLPLLLALNLVLGGCARYQPLPLPEGSPLVANVARLDTRLPRGCAGVRPVNPADGLDLDEIAVLAAVNDPDLIARRAALGVAQAQVLAAGLFPDPQISAGWAFPTSHMPGLVGGWGLALNYDFIALLTRPARLQAARRHQEQVHLQILWQEWQVIRQARTLAVRYLLENQRLARLRAVLELYRKRSRRSARALASGDITLDVHGTDLTALLQLYSQINQLRQTHNVTGHRLRRILGLEPAAPLKLAPLPDYPPVAQPDLTPILPSLPSRRPDLLALKAGYRSQEARVRAAILAQFPSLSLGVAGARDTGSVNTVGPTATLTLPLFAGNRGRISMERATRAQLAREFQARLAEARVEVDQFRRQQAIILDQMVILGRYLPQLEPLVVQARGAYNRGEINPLIYLNLELTLLKQQLARIRLQQTLWSLRFRLEALLAWPESLTEHLAPPPSANAEPKT